MKASQSRQKSYVDQRRKPLEFVVGEHVEDHSVGRVIHLRKLSPQFIGPYLILRRIGLIAYEIALPPQLANLHQVFHVSQLRKYMPNSSHVLDVENFEVKEDLSLEVLPVSVVDRQTKSLRSKSISLVKVVQDGRTCDFTWQLEEDMRKLYPHLFFGKFNFQSQIFLLLRKM